MEVARLPILGRHFQNSRRIHINMDLVSANLLHSHCPSSFLQSNSWKSTTVQQHTLLFRSSNLCTGSTRLPLECNSLDRKFRNVARRTPSLVQCSNQVVATAAETASSVGALEARFGCAGVKFREAAGYTIMEMKLKDGSSARVLLQTAVISSYKTKMWHGGLEELLYTQVVEADGDGYDNDDDDDDDEAKRRPTTVGGIVLRVSESEDESRMVMSECWVVEDVKSDPVQYVQVSLSTTATSASPDGHSSGQSLLLKYVITLTRASLSSAVIISNTSKAAVSICSSIQTNVAVNYVDGVAALGLQGCGYFSSPAAAVPSRQGIGKPEITTSRKDFFSNLQQVWDKVMGAESTSGSAITGEGCSVEEDEYVDLYGGFQRLYTMAPDSISLLDRGRRRALEFNRIGFEDIRVTNVGEESGLENWDSFVLVGLEQLTRPVRLQPGQAWRAAQQLQNPNS